MSNTNMSTCAICGKQYKSCMSCRKELELKPWRTITDEVECYKIFLILSQYNNGYINKETAKKQLEDVKYNLNDLKESVRLKIKEILSDNNSKKAVEKTTKAETK